MEEVNPNLPDDEVIGTAIQDMAKTFRFDTTPSPLSNLPTFHPKSTRTISLDEHRRTVPAPSPPQDPTSHLQAQVDQLSDLVKNLTLAMATATAQPPKPQSLGTPRIPTTPVLPPTPERSSQSRRPKDRPIRASRVSGRSSGVGHRVARESIESAELLEPETSETPEPDSTGSGEDIIEQVAAKLARTDGNHDPWRGFRDSLWRTGVYRVDRWPTALVHQVREEFRSLVLSPDFVTENARAVLAINPAVPVEKLAMHIAVAAGWTAFSRVARSIFGVSVQKSRVPQVMIG